VSDPELLLLSYSAGDLTAEEERALFEAAAHDQSLFNQIAEADRVRHALESPGERARALAVLNAWESEHLPETIAAVHPIHRAPKLWTDLLRSILSTIATAIALRLCYGLLTAIGSSIVLPQASTTEPPVPAILHLVHAAIAVLLLAVQFTPFLKPQDIAASDHPIAHKCLDQFIAGWRWAWAAWAALYIWLFLHANASPVPDAVADVLNCLTSLPLFWCFFVLDKPSVALPGQPGRNASFRKAVGVTWGMGIGVALLAAAGRLHLWGLTEFGLVFMGIYNGLAIAFLVGRFDSHWMRVPRWMLAPLYGYALIQMIYVFFFSLPPAWQVYTYLVALLFKVCLFLVVTHLLHAGNLRRYLEAAEEGRLGPRTTPPTLP